MKLEGYSDKAILDGRNVVPVDDVLVWARWYETANRKVAQTILNRRKRIRVSTVFLGINHDFRGTDRGIWFETMVFGTSIDQEQMRYATWEEAARGHALMVRRARQARWVRGDSYSRRAMGKLMKRSKKLLRRMR